MSPPGMKGLKGVPIRMRFHDCTATALRESKYGVISGPHFPVFVLNTERYGFPVFVLNTERYGVSLRIQSENRKIRTWTLLTQCVLMYTTF